MGSLGAHYRPSRVPQPETVPAGQAECLLPQLACPEHLSNFGLTKQLPEPWQILYHVFIFKLVRTFTAAICNMNLAKPSTD